MNWDLAARNVVVSFHATKRGLDILVQVAGRGEGGGERHFWAIGQLEDYWCTDFLDDFTLSSALLMRYEVKEGSCQSSSKAIGGVEVNDGRRA